MSQEIVHKRKVHLQEAETSCSFFFVVVDGEAFSDSFFILLFAVFVLVAFELPPVL